MQMVGKVKSLKTVLYLGVALSLTGCMGASINDMSLFNKAPSQETTGSIASSSYNAGYAKQYAEWKSAYASYDEKANIYWNLVAEKRKARNQKLASRQAIALNDYVLTQPPIYNGPAKPKLPDNGVEKKTQQIPGVNDFIAASKRVYGFTPERPQNEADFMRSYAKAAQEIGLSSDQLVAIYAFETGGDGTHDLQSGMIKTNVNARPISTAIGYNQLVATASVSLMWEYGGEIEQELRQQAVHAVSNRRQVLLNKANIVSKMTAKAKTVPHQWSRQAELAKTDAGLGIHAMTMDKDVGPLLQIHKLKTSIQFIKRKGVTRHLSGAELEMLNLTGDGNGFDMVTMPEAFRAQVPTANFFLRTGFERNPVAKHNNTVDALIRATNAKMQTNMQRDGAQALFRAFQTNSVAQNN